MVGWLTNDQLGGIQNKVAVALLSYYPVICLKEMRKSIYQPRFQLTPQKYKSQALSISTPISVMPLSNSAGQVIV
jgi:hypothetical protein